MTSHGKLRFGLRPIGVRTDSGDLLGEFLAIGRPLRSALRCRRFEAVGRAQVTVVVATQPDIQASDASDASDALRLNELRRRRHRGFPSRRRRPSDFAELRLTGNRTMSRRNVVMTEVRQVPAGGCAGFLVRCCG